MGLTFANLLEIGREGLHEKNDIEVKPVLQFLLLEAKSSIKTIYASLWYKLYQI